MKSQKIEENTVKRSKQTPQVKEQHALDGVETSDQPIAEHGINVPSNAYESSSRITQAGIAGLAIILEQLVTYFSDRADAHDLDVLSFSLHHLFCRVDFLYQTALGGLAEGTVPTIAGQSPVDTFLHQQLTWTSFQTIKRTFHRIEPLCHLLSDATECVLNALDLTDKTRASPENSAATDSDNEENWLHVLKQERWEQAITALTESLRSWQQYHGKIALFVAQFPHLASAIPALAQLDRAFNILLDSVGAIFGDILPGFQAISAGEDEAVATLLFDLMQQADQLLLQLAITREHLEVLIEHFAVDKNMK